MNQKEAEKETGSSVKILLLEDYPDLIEFYGKGLEKAGFKVLIEDDEDQGLDLAVKEKPDLIILDISLPKDEDFSFVKELKNRQEVANIPVIVLTDLSAEEDVKKGLSAGAAEYLIRKDYIFAEVVDKIKEIINKSKNLK
jgi:two-component system, OmpR family, alkaline phosphatase synthesis response regulator PhoP